MFCLICREQCIKTFVALNGGMFSSVFKKNIPNNTTPTFQEVGGVN